MIGYSSGPTIEKSWPGEPPPGKSETPQFRDVAEDVLIYSVETFRWVWVILVKTMSRCRSFKQG